MDELVSAGATLINDSSVLAIDSSDSDVSIQLGISGMAPDSKLDFRVTDFSEATISTDGVTEASLSVSLPATSVTCWEVKV